MQTLKAKINKLESLNLSHEDIKLNLKPVMLENYGMNIALANALLNKYQPYNSKSTEILLSSVG